MIKNIGQEAIALKTYDSGNWTKKYIDDVRNPEVLNSSSISQGISERGFGDFMRDSVKKVNDLQNEANLEMQKLASGQSGDLHQTLLTIEKAEIAFKTLNQIRLKILDAYKEVMKVQV